MAITSLWRVDPFFFWTQAETREASAAHVFRIASVHQPVTAGWFGCPQVRAWQPVTADSAPAARHSHSAVLDAQRMWVFGGHVGQGPRSQHS